MADNRQFADHGVIGGVDVFYEDKKLAESPSQSSVASTDYFVLKDTDGVPHKIVKSDVLEMVRDAMGTILANNNKGTSVAKVPTIGSSGNDLGSSSVADLASVLGGAGRLFPQMSDTNDFNDMTGYGIYTIGSAYGKSNAPAMPSGEAGGHGFMIVYSWNLATRAVQLLVVGYSIPHIYMRTRYGDNSWTSWTTMV